VDASPEIARLLVALLAFEILLRLVRAFRGSAWAGGGDNAVPARQRA
jgi:hypothetical protein